MSSRVVEPDHQGEIGSCSTLERKKSISGIQVLLWDLLLLPCSSRNNNPIQACPFRAEGLDHFTCQRAMSSSGAC